MTRYRVLAVEVFTLLVVFACWAISYRTQVDWAMEHRFRGWEAWLFPAAADAAALAAMFRLQVGIVRRGGPTLEVWGVFLGASLAMAAVNVLFAWGDLAGAIAHGVVPVVAITLWWSVIHGRPTEPAPVPAAHMDVDKDEDMSPTPVTANGHGPRTRSDSEKSARVKALAEERGISIRHARRILEKETLTTPLPADPAHGQDGQEPNPAAERTS